MTLRASLLLHKVMKQENSNTRPTKEPACEHSHFAKELPQVDFARLERASSLFRALGDPARLQLLVFLNRGECCVTELVEATGEKFSTISQRLRILRTEGLILRRRVGLHVYYKLADGHVAQLLANALEHAAELNATGPKATKPDFSKEDDE